MEYRFEILLRCQRSFAERPEFRLEATLYCIHHVNNFQISWKYKALIPKLVIYMVIRFSFSGSVR